MTVVTTKGHFFYGNVRHHKCSHCEKPLTLPYMAWDSFCVGPEEEAFTLFLCGKCCEWIKRGFCADLQRIAAMMAAIRLGFEVPNVGAISGGFLYTGTTEKQ
jgi:formate dehydrogenase maturation protein FdhE